MTNQASPAASLLVTPAPITQDPERLIARARGESLVGFWRPVHPLPLPDVTDEPYSAQRRARAEFQNSLPWPGDHLDPSMSFEERERVASLVDSFPVAGKYRGGTSDRLTGERLRGNGDRVAVGYRWPEQLGHYVRRHGLRLSPRFLADLGAQAQPK